MDDIVLLGYGGHAKSVADSIVQGKKYRIVGYTDVSPRVCDYLYLGTDSSLEALFNRGVRMAAIGIGFMGESSARDSLIKFALSIGFDFPCIIDPSATIASDAIIGAGTFVGKKAVINAKSVVGCFSIINTAAVVEHDGVVGDYSHVAVNAVLCGGVVIGSHSLIGAGTVVLQEKTIGDNCIVGANSTVLSDVSDNQKVYGIVAAKVD